MPNFKRQAKTAFEALVGSQVRLDPSADLDAVRHWIKAARPKATANALVRLGRDGDGGYVAPDDLNGVVASISPGVSTEISFDSAMAEQGIPVFMADASVDGPPTQHDLFHFNKKFVDVFEDDQNMRLDTLCDQAPLGDLILQMDIEGAEYRTLLDVSDETLQRFRIMVIEFHHLTRAFGQFSFEMIRATFNKLARHHEVVHIHPNNVCGPEWHGGLGIVPVMEFVFWRRDRAKLDPSAKLQIPHPLDIDNIEELPSVALPDCWWRD